MSRFLPKSMRGLVSRATRFSVGSMLWLSLVAALGCLWYLDRRQLQRQIDMVQGRDSTRWSIDQVLGPPNTKTFGDVSTAWASRIPDADEEWIVVEFPSATKPASLEIYETYNPGAVVEVRAVNMSGAESVLWSGKDPLAGTAGGKAVIPMDAAGSVRRFKIIIDSDAVAGWNEIDAVAVVDQQGGRQWAAAAWASSSYGFNREAPGWFWP